METEINERIESPESGGDRRPTLSSPQKNSPVKVLDKSPSPVKVLKTSPSPEPVESPVISNGGNELNSTQENGYHDPENPSSSSSSTENFPSTQKEQQNVENVVQNADSVPEDREEEAVVRVEETNQNAAEVEEEIEAIKTEMQTASPVVSPTAPPLSERSVSDLVKKFTLIFQTQFPINLMFSNTSSQQLDDFKHPVTCSNTISQ